MWVSEKGTHRVQVVDKRRYLRLLRLEPPADRSLTVSSPRAHAVPATCTSARRPELRLTDIPRPRRVDLVRTVRRPFPGLRPAEKGRHCQRLPRTHSQPSV